MYILLPALKEYHEHNHYLVSLQDFLSFTRHGGAGKKSIGEKGGNNNTRKEVIRVSEEEKKLIQETVGNLKHLDKESLLVVKGSVEVLRARDAMDKDLEKEKRDGCMG